MLDTSKTVINALSLTKCQSIKELAVVTGMKVSTINSVMARLIDDGYAKVGPETRDRSARTYLLVGYVSAAEAVMKTSRRTATLTQVRELQAEIDKLNQWKVWAISLRPELGADPIVVKARQLFAAKIPASEMKNDVLAGRLDTDPAMEVLVDVLRQQAA